MRFDSLNKLPCEMRTAWSSVFSTHKDLGFYRASKIANESLRKSYKFCEDKVISESNDMKGMKLVRSGLLFPEFTLEGYVSTTAVNKDGKRVVPNVLKILAQKGAISQKGDVEHEAYAKQAGLFEQRSSVCDDMNTEGLYFLKEYSLDGDKIKFKVGLNKDHPLYYKYLKLNKQGQYLGLSAEFNNYIEDKDGNVIYAESMDWSVTQTGNQMNPEASMKIAVE